MKKIKYIASAFMLSFMITSCEMERFPYDVIETSQSFESVKDAKNWDNIFYTQLRSRYYGAYTYTTDVQADQLNATKDYGNRNGAPHRWDFLADDYSIRDVWAGYYSALNNINTAIEGFKTITPADAAEQKLLDQYVGDAHLARAYYYLNLVLRWAKPYNATTAGTDLGVPLVLVSELNGLPARATVQKTYDQILADIQVAKTNLGSLVGQAGATRFNMDVVTALEARVKLYMNDMRGAKDAAESLIVGGKYPLYTTEADLLKMWKNDASQEVIFAPFVKVTTELPQVNNIYIGYNSAAKDYRPDFVPSQWVIDMYQADDLRKSVYFKQVDLFIQGARYAGTIVNKFPGNPALYTGAVSNYANSQKMFRIAEMFLIASEANFKIDETIARGWLNNLRTARGLANVTTSGSALLQDIKDERFRELAFEGFRLDDLRRWGEGFTRKQPQDVAYIQTGSNFDVKSVQPGDQKFVWGLPARDITVNSNLAKEQNPGW